MPFSNIIICIYLLIKKPLDLKMVNIKMYNILYLTVRIPVQVREHGLIGGWKWNIVVVKDYSLPLD